MHQVLYVVRGIKVTKKFENQLLAFFLCDLIKSRDIKTPSILLDLPFDELFRYFTLIIDYSSE